MNAPIIDYSIFVIAVSDIKKKYKVTVNSTQSTTFTAVFSGLVKYAANDNNKHPIERIIIQ